MDRPAPSARVLRLGPLSILAVTILLVAAACGGGGSGGGGGGGGSADQVIAIAQNAFGTTMTGGTVEGDTITITLREPSPAMAKLFMCGQIKGAVEQSTPGMTVVMIDDHGATLYTLDQCK